MYKCTWFHFLYNLYSVNCESFINLSFFLLISDTFLDIVLLRFHTNARQSSAGHFIKSERDIDYSGKNGMIRLQKRQSHIATLMSPDFHKCINCSDKGVQNKAEREGEGERGLVTRTLVV